MRYEFDEFLIDGNTRELLRATEPVSVEPQVFSLIVHLLENRNRVVSKNELIEAIWDGRFVSEAAVSSRVKSARRALGDCGRVQKYIKTVHGHGFRFAANDVSSWGSAHASANSEMAAPQRAGIPAQRIRFCRSADGARIAYATAGEGNPIVMAQNCFNHLEYDWHSPVWSHIHTVLTRNNKLVRHDTRGSGLSDWTAEDFSFARQLEDLEAVVDTMKLERFPLFGFAHGSALSAAYAAKHPDRVSKLVLVGGYTHGWRVAESAEHRQVFEALLALVRNGWARNSDPFRHLVTSLFMPASGAEEQASLNELQRIAWSPENASRLMEAFGDFSIQSCLPGIKAPTLVIHARGDKCVPFLSGRELAAGIEGAEFMMLDTSNHMIPAGDPVWQRCSNAIEEFLSIPA